MLTLSIHYAGRPGMERREQHTGYQPDSSFLKRRGAGAAACWGWVQGRRRVGLPPVCAPRPAPAAETRRRRGNWPCQCHGGHVPSLGFPVCNRQGVGLSRPSLGAMNRNDTGTRSVSCVAVGIPNTVSTSAHSPDMLRPQCTGADGSLSPELQRHPLLPTGCAGRQSCHFVQRP